MISELHPRAVHIVGGRNGGKTTLMQFLLRELSSRGLKVGALKHSSHPHPTDKPDSDSDRMRKAGALPAAFWTANGLALQYPPEEAEAVLESAFRDCDLLLVESLHSAPAPKIVVESATAPAADYENVIAVVNAAAAHPHLPAFRQGDDRLVDFLLDYLNLAK